MHIVFEVDDLSKIGYDALESDGINGIVKYHSSSFTRGANELFKKCNIVEFRYKDMLYTLKHRLICETVLPRPINADRVIVVDQKGFAYNMDVMGFYGYKKDNNILNNSFVNNRVVFD